MAAAKGKTDIYANIVNRSITMSAANTITFEEIDVGLNIFDKVGLLLHRFDVEINNATKIELNASADELDIALTQSNQVSELTYDERAVIDKMKLSAHTVGTAATYRLEPQPYTIDWTDLPGGGLLIAPRPLYLAADSIGFGAAAYATTRIYFTIVQLKPEEYFEILESRRFFG